MDVNVSVDKAEKILSPVHSEREFRLHLGASLKSIYELSEALEIMNEESFRHHVSEHKNDFAPWVRDVLGDKMLAAQVEKMTKRKEISDALKLRIKELERRTYHSLLGDELKAGAKEFILGLLIGFIVGIMVMRLIGA